MKKPASLRAALIKALPELKRNPDRLSIFIESGSIVATGAPSISYEYRYSATLLLTDFGDHPDAVIVPLLEWVKLNQSELMTNPERRENGIEFEAEILNHKTIDLAIKLALTERVVVGADPQTGKTTVTHCDEPSQDPWATAFP